MPKAVLDSTVLISAFLAKTGVSAELLHKAKNGGFDICLAEEILEEVQRALLQYQKIRKRYHYLDQTVIQYVQTLRMVARLITEIPLIEVVDSDPNDNMVVACALKAQADYIVTRDNDLLSLKNYEDIKMVTPEKFIGILRKGLA
ncbi:MAG TPA: putative toxin-antitoxin system toxin component, PIN family [Candidatus Wunengus sp. YC60]|uniref:putative toxin-antitoxin system toxin component, PIN family n=1 Tax=Candidatus Wunengus sp. YC60 TaxID=3367697 RepID=UPI0040290FAB